MNVMQITMPKAEARRRLKDYRAGLHRKADAEYEAVATAYRELANGRDLLDLGAAFRNAPIDERGRPRLAIARADRPQVRVSVPRQAGERITFSTGRGSRANAHRANWMRWITVDRPIIAGQLPAGQYAWQSDVVGHALVPLVPPDVRLHHALDRCHILWEVEAWADQPLRAEPDRDPFLLRFVGGDLWAVLGEWDLTDVERSVMAGRRAD